MLALVPAPAPRVPVPASEDRRHRLGRTAIQRLAPVPGESGWLVLLNASGRPAGRTAGTKGPLAAKRKHRVHAAQLDLTAASPAQDGAFIVFELHEAPWLSRRHERTYWKRIARLLRRPREPGRLTWRQRDARAAQRRAGWEVLEGRGCGPRASTAHLTVLRGESRRKGPRR